MTTIKQARAGLAAAVLAGTSIRCDDYETDQIVAPCFQVGRNPFNPQLAQGSQTKAEHHFRVRHYVPRTADKQAQEQLDSAAETSGATSLKVAVETSSNWGSVDVDYAEVVEVGEIVEVSRGDAVYLMVEYDVRVVF